MELFLPTIHCLTETFFRSSVLFRFQYQSQNFLFALEQKRIFTLYGVSPFDFASSVVLHFFFFFYKTKTLTIESFFSVLLFLFIWIRTFFFNEIFFEQVQNVLECFYQTKICVWLFLLIFTYFVRLTYF